jgi:Uma2 family endonuclease
MMVGDDSSIRNRPLEANSMAASTQPAKPREPIADASNGAIPPLENGDRLTRAEFERRYDAMAHVTRAELIEGHVFLPGPIRPRQHSFALSMLISCLGGYEKGTSGVEARNNGRVRLDKDKEFQPDACLVVRPERGGQVRISEGNYIDGEPELVAEVATSSVSYNLGKKLNVYRRCGVREYIVWRVLDRQIDWFVNCKGQLELMPAGRDGILRSKVFPGLWLDPSALVQAETAKVMSILDRGLKSPEHADFVDRLERASKA